MDLFILKTLKFHMKLSGSTWVLEIWKQAPMWEENILPGVISLSFRYFDSNRKATDFVEDSGVWYTCCYAIKVHLLKPVNSCELIHTIY